MTSDKALNIDGEKIFRGHAVEVSEELRNSSLGTHALVLYPDLLTLRELYSFYARSALGDSEIFLFLPYLETVANVKRVLSEDSANIDVRKYEKEQSLLIMDSLKGYFGLQEGLIPFLLQTADFAKKSGKSLSVLSDMGSFFYYNKKDDLLQYEMSLPSRYERMNLKGFCAYNLRDFNVRFSDKERQDLIKHHGRTLMLLSSSNGN
ncbi:MAG TPA: MEDS domain-containing protein [Nitrososphaeraceae archaeon]|nr:MEDS domain-containing protein [Nitrososphaeraceae archaeon]